MTFLRVILFLTLLVACGYFVLKFFGKLTDIDIFSAIAWSFRAKSNTRQSIGILPYAGIFCYLLCFIFFYLFFRTPFQIPEMKENHTSGLLGYCEDVSHARIYDPSLNTYINYEYFNPPRPANKFTETFKVVVFYKKPSRNYYQDSKLFTLPTILIEILIGSLMLVVLYLVLYTLVKEYIGQNNLPDKLSHHFMLTQFRDIVRLPLSKVLILALFIIIVIISLTLISVQKLRNNYEYLYASDQERLRTELLDKISPEDTIRGVVFSRSYQQKARTSTTSRGKTIYYYFVHYTIEFNNLIKIPVYLDLKFDEESPEAKELSKLFPDNANVPGDMKEFTFLVNPDYSISLKMDKNTPEE